MKKINDGLTNDQRYRKNNPEKCRKRSLDNYYKNRGKRLSQGKEWRRENKEKVLQLSYKWRSENIERSREIDRNCYHRNKTEILKKVSKRRKLDRENQNEIKRRWYRNNSEVARAQSHRKKARRVALKPEGYFCSHDISWKFKKQYGLCFYCAESIQNGYEIDHIIPLSKGGSSWPGNIALACAPCNRTKRDHTEGWGQHWVHHQG